MKSVNRDRNLSGTLIFLTLGFVLYILGADDGFTVKNTMSKTFTLRHFHKLGLLFFDDLLQLFLADFHFNLRIRFNSLDLFAASPTTIGAELSLGLSVDLSAF